jgi:hypothetical protein
MADKEIINSDALRDLGAIIAALLGGPDQWR